MEPIRTAIVGAGASARIFHRPFLARDARFQVGAVVARAETGRALLPNAELFPSVEALFAWRPELVVLCTPNHTHFELARRCLQAGCHVVVEKPFTASAAEGEELIALAKARRLLLTVFHNRRWDGDFLTVQELVTSGALGRLVEAELRFDRWVPGRRPKAWKERAAPGNALLDDLGSHLVDQALVLFGWPAAVQAQLACQRDGSAVEDAFDLSLRWPGEAGRAGLAVRLKGSLLVREEPPRISLFGTGGAFLKWGVDPQEAQLSAGLSPGDPAFGRDDEAQWGLFHRLRPSAAGEPVWERSRLPTRRGDYAAFHDNLARALREGAPLLVEPREALAVVRVIEAARQSAAEGRIVLLPPA